MGAENMITFSVPLILYMSRYTEPRYSFCLQTSAAKLNIFAEYNKLLCRKTIL